MKEKLNSLDEKLNLFYQEFTPSPSLNNTASNLPDQVQIHHLTDFNDM